VTRVDLHRLAQRAQTDRTARLDTILRRDVTVAYPDEPLRTIVHRMAETGLTRFPVVERRGDHRRLVGMISLEDLLKARLRNLEAERRRERVMRVKIAFPFGLRRSRDTTT
jgi:CBS domain-containing protein